MSVWVDRPVNVMYEKLTLLRDYFLYASRAIKEILF